MLSSTFMDSHLIILDRVAIRVVRFRQHSLAPDLPFTNAVARLRERRPEPVFVMAFFIGLLATLGVLVSHRSTATACGGNRSSAGADRSVNIQQASRTQRVAMSER